MDRNVQTAVITGGASGMGKACATELKKRGNKVVVWDKNLTEEEGIHSIICDVTDGHSVENAMQETREIAGIPRVCVSCAGIAPAKKMFGKEGIMPLSDFKKVINVNLLGSFNVMRVVTAAMAELEPEPESGERGVFIHTASIAAYEGQIGQTAYAASKGGVVAMILPAARELARYAIRVNAIAPGLIATPMLLNMPMEVQDSLISTLNFPKRFGKPEEFAALVCHIIDNTMINGEVIRLDGGLRMQGK